MRHRILLAASLFYLLAANVIWISIDTRPPFWDMANHARWSLDVLRDFQQNGIAATLTLPRDSGSYPPLYYAVTAVFYRIFGASIDTAQMANIPAMILLALATYGIARFLMEPFAAAIAGVIANFIPFMLWLSRESLIDYWLASMVAVSLWSLQKTNEFSKPKWSLVFGLCCGLGLLTKWTFVVFVGAPALWAARKNTGNGLKAAVVAAVIASYWYVPQFVTMPAFWRQNAAAARVEQDPTQFSFQSLIYYIRALEGSLLFLPLFIAFLAGLFVVLRNRNRSFPQWSPLILGLAGSWVGLLLLPSVDPRYAAPALSMTAVFAAAVFEKRRVAQVGLIGFLLFQHYLVSFGIPQLPERIILLKGADGPLPFDWNLYTQTYFGLWGGPKREEWFIDRVLQRVSVSASASRPARVGLIPDLPRFDVPAFQFFIALHRYPVVLDRQFSQDEKALEANDYLLLSIGRQTAFGSQAPHAEEIHDKIARQPERFEVIDTFTLPSGDAIQLYQCVR